MAENTQSAKCTDFEFKTARLAGIQVWTTNDETAIHEYAVEIRREQLRKTPPELNNGLIGAAQALVDISCRDSIAEIHALAKLELEKIQTLIKNSLEQ